MIWCIAPALAGSIEGHVFAETGEPVVGAVVEVGGSTVRTDAAGHYAVVLPGGSYAIHIDADGLVAGGVEIRVADDGATEVLVTLSPTAQAGFLIEQPDDGIAAEPTVALLPIQGVIRGPDGVPMPGVRVFLRGIDGLQRTDAEGHFELLAPEGNHLLTVVAPGYDRVEQAVDTGSTVQVTLVEASRALAAYTIRAPYLEGSVAGLLDARKDGAAVADVLGADEMRRNGDSDAASALARVTGLTVVDGKYVFVRGLGDRYSSSLLNGGILPSPEPERRVVPLDLFPTQVLAGVVVQKSWSPDMPGEFGGGVVQLDTVEAPEGWTSSIGLSGSYRHGTTLQKGLTAAGGPTDFLGFDGGARALPQAVADASSDSPLEEGDRFSDRGYSAEELEKFGEAMSSDYSPVLRALPPGLSVNASLGNGFERDDVQGGLLAAVTFGNEWRTQRFDRTYYVPDEQGLRPQHRYAFDQSTNEVNLGAFLTGTLTFGGTELAYTGMISRSSDDSARVYQGYNDDVGQDIRVTRTRWVERQLFWNQLAGTHALGKFTLGWHALYAGAGRLEPDRKETRFDNEPGTDRWLLSDRPEGNGRFFSDAGEQDLEGAVDLAVNPWRTADREGPQLKVGARVTHRSREVDTRRFKYFHKGPASRDGAVLAGTPETIFTPDHIGAEGFQFEEFTRQTDNYTASHRVLAAFAMTEVPIAPWLTVMAGARIESSVQQVQTFELFNPDSEPVDATLKTLDVLPAATLTVAPVEQVRLRAGIARTVSRPDFRELSPATFNDVTGGRQTFGNPELGRARIDHVDLRFEWFPRSAEVISVGVFAKRFVGPVETVVVPSAQQSVTWENAAGATNVGVELEARRSLPLNTWVAGNLALIRSRVDLGENAGIQTSTKRALQGQSPWVFNVAAGWQHPDRGDRVTVLLNAVGPRITEVGALGAPDIFLAPVPQLDVVGRKDLGAGFTAGLSLGNLLDLGAITRQGDELIDRIRNGWTAGISVGWSAP